MGRLGYSTAGVTTLAILVDDGSALLPSEVRPCVEHDLQMLISKPVSQSG